MVSATSGQLGDTKLAGDSSSSSATTLSRIHCFSEQAPDATLHFQIIDLGLQLYIWVAVGGAKLQNMYLAIQSKQNPVPSVATLLPDATSSAASSMAQRLAKRVGRPVICSCNLPQNSDTLQVLAERRLIQELKTLGLAGTPAAALAVPEVSH